MARILLLIFLVTILARTAQSFDYNILTNQIHLLHPKIGAGRTVSCRSWQFGAETNNIIEWNTFPEECESYIERYLVGSSEYREDSKVVTNEAYLHARTLKLPRDGRNVWIFDIDETSLSQLPYFEEHGFSFETFNSTAYQEWFLSGSAPALPESLKLYDRLLSLRIKIVFLTGRAEEQRTFTEANLKSAGYNTWEKLLLRGSDDIGKPAVVFKSEQRKKLENFGYRIVGNIGDQWSDILGTNTGLRTFKLPNPMYYVP